MNPEFQRQLWLRLSFSRLVGMPLMIWLAALAFYVLSNGSLNAVGGLGAVGFVLMVAGLGIQHAASSVVDEVQEKTWDQQRLCAMQPWSMTWGKWLGSTLMAWYGGLLCWIVAVACALHFGVPTAQIVWLSVLGVLLGIGAQTLGLTFNLVAAESGSIRQGRVATWLGLLLILPWLLRLGDWSLYANASMQWGGLTMSVLVFLLASATLACVCTVVAAWRSMARALSVRQWPWGWPMLVLVLSVYMAGFMPELNWQVFTVMGFIVAVGMTYLALLQERVSLPTWRRLVADARLGEVGFISSVSQAFCSSCTRARLSADGRLFSCLFAHQGLDLRTPLRAGWLGLKGYGASKAAQGRAEQRQQQEIANARAALDAVEVTRRPRSDDDRRELRARHTRPG